MIRVAIVEDDLRMREQITAALAQAHDILVIASAASVAEGHGLIEAGGFDVLLCDLGLPDGSGIDLIRREAAKGRDTDIIVITLFADQGKVLDSIKAGARGYLLKDEPVETCIAAVRDIRRGGSPISPMIARQLLNQINLRGAAAELPPVSPLSEREFEVLNLLSRGFSYNECSEILHVMPNTIGSHVKNIYRKLEVNSRAEAIFEANAKGLLRRG